MYTKPELFIEFFETEDVLTASSVPPVDSNPNLTNLDPNETPFMPLG